MSVLTWIETHGSTEWSSTPHVVVHTVWVCVASFIVDDSAFIELLLTGNFRLGLINGKSCNNAGIWRNFNVVSINVQTMVTSQTSYYWQCYWLIVFKFIKAIGAGSICVSGHSGDPHSRAVLLKASTSTGDRLITRFLAGGIFSGGKIYSANWRESA